jgi:hypothetical protein
MLAFLSFLGDATLPHILEPSHMLVPHLKHSALPPFLPAKSSRSQPNHYLPWKLAQTPKRAWLFCHVLGRALGRIPAGLMSAPPASCPFDEGGDCRFQLCSNAVFSMPLARSKYPMNELNEPEVVITGPPCTLSRPHSLPFSCLPFSLLSLSSSLFTPSIQSFFLLGPWAYL